MNSRDTTIGIVVLGLLLGGAYFTRTRSTPAPSSSQATTRRGSPPTSDETAHDVTLRDVSTDIENGVRLTLSVSPRPPVAFAPLDVRVRVESRTEDPVAATVDDVRATFEMEMPMGEHRYALLAGTDGWYHADVTLPLCASGNPRWFVTVEASVSGRPIRDRFRLDLTGPR